MRRAALFALAVLGAGQVADAHERHGAPGPAPAGPAGAVAPLPWAAGGPFRLIDDAGRVRTEHDPEGRLQLVFFGYVNCPGICSAAVPEMARAKALLAGEGMAVSALVITVDPERDRPGTMQARLDELAPGVTGLTGAPEALAAARAAFGVELRFLFEDPERGPIYAHGGHVFVLDGAGNVLTLMPPVLPAEEMARIVARYAGG